MKQQHSIRAAGLSRRRVLKLGAGVAVAAAAASGAGDVLAAGLPQLSGGGLPAVTKVTGVSGQTLTGRTTTGTQVSAEMVGFPVGFVPRAGDLVAVAERGPGGTAVPPASPSQLDAHARCRSASAQTVSELAAQGQLSAVAVCTWRRGVPAIDRQGRLSIQGVSLVDTPAVRAAAASGTPIAICTLDSTLPSLQVLATRS